MAYKHRFYDELIPKQNKIYYLFIGTFNPKLKPFNKADGLYDKDFYYGRATNLFWCICPHAFHQSCLIDQDVSIWKEFCEANGISLTDIVKEVVPSTPDIERDTNYLTVGYSDSKLEVTESGKPIYELDFSTQDIKLYIDANRETLKGVYFTRKSFSGIPRIKLEWQEIEAYCKEKSITCSTLPTPSTWGNGLRQTINEWRNIINVSNT